MTLNPVAPIDARVPEWTFAERLRKARRDLGWRQADMAERLGVKPSTYEAWETGRNKPDVADLAEKLEGVTGITRLWFVGWTDGGGTGPNPDGTVTWLYPRKSHNWGRVTPIGGRTVSSTTRTGSGGQKVAA
jgi:transcriptional regulator with XRE-family HTH domain